VILDFLSELNWLAVLVATVAWFAFSAIWYSVPPISGAWMRAAKVSPGEGPPLVNLLVPTFIGYFITTAVVAMIARGIGATTVTDGIALGLTLGVGIGLVSVLGSQLYEQKGPAYWLINGVNAVIAYSIVAIIVTLWD
jgi:hypothetical protein